MFLKSRTLYAYIEIDIIDMSVLMLCICVLE